MTLKQVVEALLFATREPLSPKEVRRVLREAAQFDPSEETKALAEAKEGEILLVMDELRDDYARTERPYLIQEVLGGFQLASRPHFALWVRQLFEFEKPNRLSAPALETLAIVAYRQPISRADVEAIRGVAVDGVITTLLERGFIHAVGRAEAPGRPVLYGTTEQFLQHFGIRDVSQLPNAEELRAPGPLNPVAAPAPEGPPPPELPLDNHETPATAHEDRQLGPADTQTAEPTS
jgi:segregation and condensation protein B